MTPGADPTAADPGPDDATLLARHVAGDPDAFAELVRRHRDRLWAVALRTLGDREEAADALQDGLLNAFRRADGYRGESAVTTWLHRVVVNACLDRVRRRTARPQDAWPEGEPVASRATVPGPALADLAAWRVDLQRALAALPTEQRLAVLLVDVEGWPVADVAVALGCAVGTVKSRCARGRARLLALLDARNPGAGSRVPSEDRPERGSRGEGGRSP